MLELVRVSEEYREQVLEFRQEFFDCGEYIINGSAMFDQLSFENWLPLTIQNQNKETVSKNWAVSSTFFLMLDSKIIGITEVRHELSTPFLREYAGHIGYSIRPSYRNQGYGTKLLALVLDYCREIGLKEVLLGCYCNNIGSINVIENNHGKCVEQKLYWTSKIR